MTVSLYQYLENCWSKHRISTGEDDLSVNLVLCFGAKDVLGSANLFDIVRVKFPQAQLVFCSTAGEIYQDTVQENSLVAVALTFSQTQVKTASVSIQDFTSSVDAARHLTQQLLADDLVYMMVLADGSMVNGSQLVQGFHPYTQQVIVTGGLAADAANFKSTLVGLNQQPGEGMIVGIGFYGKKLVVTHGSQGGWDRFGPEKEITRSEGNVLYEINHHNALDIYKKYLGPDARDLPGSALLFPLALSIPGLDKTVVRTILSIDETNKSMTFAGDVPVGAKVRFMKANFDKLTNAAANAAQQTLLPDDQQPDWAFLVSCVGRKLVYGPRIEEELEAVSETLGRTVPLAGFYANGEISPVGQGGTCQFHNQTMTVTSFYELR